KFQVTMHKPPSDTSPVKTWALQPDARKFYFHSMADTATRLNEDLKNAMRAKDGMALNTLRAVKSAIKNAAIEKGGSDTELEEGEVIAVIRKQIKQRRESMDQFNKAGREELAHKEESEINLLEDYLPSPLSTKEIDELVDATIAECNASSRSDMGRVMKILQERTAGRADGKALSQAVMKQLS
ncbi:MAG: GatB/YqeY domain-containing protein, partial [Roseibacillus sp.]|nr:GatB/YqeY domain-containing protein [Roseibacillus sp.]